MAEEPIEEEGKKKRGKKGLIIPAVALILGLAGGGYFYMSSQKSATDGEPTTTTTALGKVVRLQPITLNLSDGHVLKVGLALQMVAEPQNEELAALLAGGESHGSSSSSEVGESPLGGEEAKALDIAIAQLGNSTYDALSKPGARTEAKGALTEHIKEAYEGDVVAVYFTDFVMS